METFSPDNQRPPAGESRVQAAARSSAVEEEIQLVAGMIKDVNDGVDTPF